ncbi:MAG: biofilm PGA synthesis N-glycosyltransferase PgaC [Cyclobacteriaceae bacterium]|jgi:biofilm PGA synthesis N-glycosyltransferase PgaC
MTIFIGLSLIHTFIILWLRYHWSRIPLVKELKTPISTFTVLIPIRNEEKNIYNLLADIAVQSYPRSLFEVIVVDDHSEDGTELVIEFVLKEFDLDLKYIKLETESGKKAAITLGVGMAKNEFILTTDGDCRVGKDWVAAFASGYVEKKIVMLAGPVCMEGKSLIANLQSVEFASLIGFGAAAIKSGNPSTCNGANMSYKKEVFEAVNGYVGNEQIPSGDDEFLLQKLHANFPGQLGFLKNQSAIVNTPAKEYLSDLINQRIRWSSKWKFHKNWFARFSTVYVFTDFALYLVMAMLVLFGMASLLQFLIIISLRYLVDIFYLLSITNFFKIRPFQVICLGLALQIFYPLFVSLLGIASIFTGYSWKGRQY